MHGSSRTPTTPALVPAVAFGVPGGVTHGVFASAASSLIGHSWKTAGVVRPRAPSLGGVERPHWATSGI